MKINFLKLAKCLLFLLAICSLYLTTSIISNAASQKRLVVYYPQWGIYSPAHHNMVVGQIPWEKVSVINHAFMEVDPSYKIASIDLWADFDKQMDHSSTELKGHFGEYKYYKSKHPEVKIIISIGGWTRGQNFHAMAATKANRTIFINSLIDFLKKYPFIDGFDLDWEYPGIDRRPDPNDSNDKGCPGGPEDKKNFTALLQEIRAAYNNNNFSHKILSIAAPAGADKAAFQEPDKYHQYLDYINVMTYDFHGAWEKVTNHHAPLYKNPDDPSPTEPVDIKNTYNTDSAMKLYRDKYHIPANKLIAGTPFYSRGWKNVQENTGKNGLYAKADGAPVGPWDSPTSPGGQYPWYEIQQNMENKNGYTKFRDEKTRTPYLYNKITKIMITYEDEISLKERCDYVNNNNFGGIIVWEITGDNNNGFPMTSIIYNKIIANNPQPSVKPSASPNPSHKPSPQPSLNPSPQPSSNPQIKEWKANVNYQVNDLVTYQDKKYKCLQAHTSLVGWEPNVTPALWQPIN